MKVSEMALKELKILLREDYPDMELTEEKLIEIALNLLKTVKVIYGYRPIIDQLDFPNETDKM